MIATTFRQDKIIRETVNLHGDKQYMIAVGAVAVAILMAYAVGYTDGWERREKWQTRECSQ